MYVLMTRKSKVLYKHLFGDFIEFGEENGVQLNLQMVMTVLELRLLKEGISRCYQWGLFFPFSPMDLVENSDERFVTLYKNN